MSSLSRESIITKFLISAVGPLRSLLAFLTRTLPDQWMMVMSTQMIGFSLGGIMRRYLVQPPSMSMVPSFPDTSSLTFSQFGPSIWSPVPSSTPCIPSTMLAWVPAAVSLANVSSLSYFFPGYYGTLCPVTSSRLSATSLGPVGLPQTTSSSTSSSAIKLASE